jgi:hypothetical protein
MCRAFANSVVGILAACSVWGSALEPFVGETAEFKQVAKQDAHYVRAIPEAELPATWAVPDDSGALCKIPVASDSRKDRLLARSNIYAGGLIAFKNYLARARLEGKPSEAIWFPAKPAEVVGESNVACILEDASQSPEDILFLSRLLVDGHRGAKEVRLTGHSERPWHLVYSRSGRLVSVSDDGTIRLWDVSPSSPGCGRQVAQFPGYTRDTNGNPTRGEFAAFSPFGHWLATVFGKRVSFRRPSDGTEVFAWEPNLPPGLRIMSIRFDPNGNSLFAFIEDARETGTPQPKFLRYDIDGHRESQFIGSSAVIDGRMVGDGRYVITWDGSQNVVFWETESGKEVAALQVAPRRVYDVAFSPAGDVLVTAGDDGEVKFWKIADRSRLNTTKPYRHSGLDLVDVFGDGKYMWTGGDGWLKEWETPEFMWDRRPKLEIVSSESKNGITTNRYADGTIETSSGEGWIKRRLPNGAEETYQRQ